MMKRVNRAFAIFVIVAIIVVNLIIPLSLTKIENIATVCWLASEHLYNNIIYGFMWYKIGIIYTVIALMAIYCAIRNKKKSIRIINILLVLVMITSIIMLVLNEHNRIDNYFLGIMIYPPMIEIVPFIAIILAVTMLIFNRKEENKKYNLQYIVYSLLAIMIMYFGVHIIIEQKEIENIIEKQEYYTYIEEDDDKQARYWIKVIEGNDTIWLDENGEIMLKKEGKYASNFYQISYDNKKMELAVITNDNIIKMIKPNGEEVWELIIPENLVKKITRTENVSKEDIVKYISLAFEGDIKGYANKKWNDEQEIVIYENINKSIQLQNENEHWYTYNISDTLTINEWKHIWDDDYVSTNIDEGAYNNFNQSFLSNKELNTITLLGKRTFYHKVDEKTGKISIFTFENGAIPYYDIDTNQCGFIDLQGNIIDLALGYQIVAYDENGAICISETEDEITYYLFDKNLNQIGKAYLEIEIWEEYARLTQKDDGKQYIYDRQGKEIMSGYESIETTQNMYIGFKENGKADILNKKGEIIRLDALTLEQETLKYLNGQHREISEILIEEEANEQYYIGLYDEFNEEDK